MDDKFQDFSLTRSWRDGGRDALGYYVIGSASKANYPLRIDCAMEAKCYAENHIVNILRRNAISSENIDEWLVSLDKFDDRGVQR